MRTYDIPYVKNPSSHPYPVKPLEDLSIDEIKNKYLRICAKYSGELSSCSKCSNPCKAGKRAIQLLSTEIYNDPPIPLYGGKTLIEKAREENMKRKEEREKEEEKVEVEVKKGKDGRLYIDNWYQKATESGDPIKWIMENFGTSKSKAKHKIYSWLTRHPEDRQDNVKEEPINTEEHLQETPEVKVHSVPAENNIETKLEALLSLQEKKKKEMNEYLKLYERTKEEYEKIKQKTDILCNALDILNDA